MSNYTPTTEEVRRRCNSTDGFAQFDRWLAAHDAEIRANEREQAAQRVADRTRYSETWVVCDHDWAVSIFLSEAVAAARGEDACEEPLYPDDWGDK